LWVGGDDEFQFAGSELAFELFFALDRGGHCGEAFHLDEFVDVVFCGVGFGVDFGSVIGDSLHQVGGDAYVEFFEAACEDVDVSVWRCGHFLGGPLVGLRGSNAGILHFVQDDDFEG
jgi:hypothetical protein